MTQEEALQAIKAKMDYYESDKRLRCAIETLIPEVEDDPVFSILTNRNVGLAITSHFYELGKNSK